MKHSTSVDGFQLAYERHGRGPAVVMLHGVPGDHRDYDRLVPLVEDHADVLVPDLRGFGQSSKHLAGGFAGYSRFGQAASVAALMDELGIRDAVAVGYDIGSLTALTLAGARPDLVRALILGPPVPGAGSRLLHVDALSEFWHAALYQTPIVENVFDGNPDAIRGLLTQKIQRWQGPEADLDVTAVDHLVDTLSAPGAFTASIGWFRNADSNPLTVGAAAQTPPPNKRVTTPTTVLWPELDPLSPVAWSDRLDGFFTNVELHLLPRSGHFGPIEAPKHFATHILELLPDTA